MTYENMRGYIKARYSHAPDWCKKVDKMADEQVCAIYYRLVRARDTVENGSAKAKEIAHTRYSLTHVIIHMYENPEVQNRALVVAKISKGLCSLNENL